MNDAAFAVKDLLVAAGVGTFGGDTGWSIGIGQWPQSPDTVILINEAGGRNPFPHLRLNFPSVSIMVRGSANGHAAARTKMKSVIDALLGMASQVVNGDTYRSCKQLGDVITLGQDENRRPIFSANLSFIVEPGSGTHRTPIS